MFGWLKYLRSLISRFICGDRGRAADKGTGEGGSAERREGSGDMLEGSEDMLEGSPGVPTQGQTKGRWLAGESARLQGRAVLERGSARVAKGEGGCVPCGSFWSSSSSFC